MAIRFEKLFKLTGWATLTIIISVVTTLTTLAVNDAFYAGGKAVAISTDIGTTSSPTASLNCGDLVYSPVQNSCVEKAVFNDEMQRLFVALGIDPSIYQDQ
ncbi:hypothetical protein [Ahrensia sp. 13_GOM-1096m]|uniref:hypothetical protein n=1 Tax=Ahrensia sp. 13_GOM-1096m TaxID=1380380 RepID=UPI00047E24EB|nr:hypothetical protein [Ahrensia sp. 13_GOM-1096m]